MRLIQELRSHLQYKIILPFLILTLLVALVGSAVSFLFIAGTAQERLSNQLVQVARAVSDNLVNLERANLTFLREVAFAPANPQTGAQAVSDALASGDPAALEQAIDPYFLISTQRSNIRLDRLIAFDHNRRSVLDWELSYDQGGAPQRAADGSPARVSHPPRDLGGLWFVPQILAGQQDGQGDKFAGLLQFNDSATHYFFSVAPVFKGQQIVGGLIIAFRLDNVLADLNAQSQSAMVALYQAQDGATFASSTVPESGLQALNVRPELLPTIHALEIAKDQSVIDLVTVNGREYQFAYAPLQIRSTVVGLFSVGLANDYVTGPWEAARLPLTILTITLMLAIIGLGIFIARQITRPLQELVSTAQAVIGGDLERRSQVTVRDEIGILSNSFNAMTAHLLDLYRAVHAEASQRAAIVESITDGVVVCDPSGAVLVINRATRALLDLDSEQEGPRRFEDIPLAPISDPAQIFGQAQASDMFNIGERIVRVSSAPVLAENGQPIGDVYVLQDLTSEVAMDRAKTNFIATISHELRTPLTVLGGSTDLLLRNLIGPLNDEQRSMIETMRKSALSMTSLINNVITIAGLESGTLTFDLEQVALADVLDSLLWSIRNAMTAKGLELVVSLPDDLPDVLADAHQVRNVFQQLLDNARRYTESGSVQVRATHQGREVRVDVIDTGPGIGDDLAGQLFMRFTRGAEGINSAERGIGLGLAIAKQLLERQGGALWLEATSEHGSTFSFTLPCFQPDQQYQDSSLANVA